MVWDREVEEVRPNPSCDQRTSRLAESDPGQVPDRVDCHLRVVGAGLHHDVAAGASGLEIIAGEVRQVDEGVRAASVQAEAGLRRPFRTGPRRTRR